MKLINFGVLILASAEKEKLDRKPRQRFYGQRYTPQGYDYNYNYPRYNDYRPYDYESVVYGPQRNNRPQETYNQRPRFQPSRHRTSFRNNHQQPPSQPSYDYQPSINRNGYYHQNGEYSFRVQNQFKNDRVPVARPGHLARQGGRKVRPPGVLDDRVLNPRTKNMNADGRVIDPTYGFTDYDSSSSEYEHKIAYTYDEDYTAISEENYDTDTFSGDGHDLDQIKQNELVSEGPSESRPTRPVHPDLVGLADILTEPESVQQSVTIDWMFLSNLTCALEEGCLSDSAYNSVGGVDRLNLRKLLRFTQKITNIGDADFIAPTHPNEWQYHTCTKEYHSMRVLTSYELLSQTRERARTVVSSHKASFCLEDTECANGRKRKYDCKNEQAISPGCSDIHDAKVDCQWIDLTDVPDGHYILKIEVNPGHLVAERSFANNVLNCDVYIGQRHAWAKNCRN